MGHALKISPGIIRKSRVLYPGSGFLASATWPPLPKKHYNGLINQNQSINQKNEEIIDNFIERNTQLNSSKDKLFQKFK